MKHLTKEQRYQIEAYLKCGKSKKYIAEAVGVHKSSVYRELKRNSGKKGAYSAFHANEQACERKERFASNRVFDECVEKRVLKRLITDQWSPEQISGYYSLKGEKMASHERIYQYIREDKAKGGTLYKHCRHRLKHRKRPVGKASEKIKDRVSIDQRPDIVDERSRAGDWEIDTIVGKNNKGAIVTFVERATGFFMMKKLQGKNADELADAVIKALIPYKNIVFTITGDNGLEFARHKRISERLGADFYFTHPYSSWEKGLIECTNKLIRQYIPKKTDFNDLNDIQITEIQYKINSRPRKKLGYENPKTVFYKLAS